MAEKRLTMLVLDDSWPEPLKARPEFDLTAPNVSRPATQQTVTVRSNTSPQTKTNLKFATTTLDVVNDLAISVAL